MKTLAIQLLTQNNIPSANLTVTQFRDDALGKVYQVYLLDTGSEKYVMKAGAREYEACQRWFSSGEFPVPKIYPQTIHIQQDTWFLMEYLPGRDLRQAEEAILLEAVRCLACIHSRFWVENPEKQPEDRYSGYYRRFIPRFPEAQDLQMALEEVITRMETCPRTLIHDDLLPINVQNTSRGIRFFDWQYCGLFPYFMDICRLLCHEAVELGCSFSPELRTKAFKEYYDTLIKSGCTALSPETFQNDIRLGAIAELISCIQQEDRHQWQDLEREYYNIILSLT